MQNEITDFKKFSKTGSIIAAVGALVMIISLTLFFLININKSKEIQGLTQHIEGLANHSSWEYEQAAKAHKIYYFPSITMHLSIIDTSIRGAKYRLVKMRNHYTLDALRDIDINENVFLEEYDIAGAEVIPWKGSDREDPVSISNDRYWVRFSSKKDQEKTIITGADFLYAYPLQRIAQGFYINGERLDSTQRAFSYPNDDDFIGDFKITVDSLSPHISLPEKSMIREGNGYSFVGKAGLLYQTADTSNANNSKAKDAGRLPGKYHGIICEWQNLRPGDEVGIIFNW